MEAAQSREPVALKEWAVTVKALQEGQLMLVMRKGGIIEETRDFQLVSKGFYLMPAFEHQKEHLLKEEYQGQIQGTMQGWTPDMPTIKLGSYAEAVEDIEITDQETLDRIRNYHIWTDAFAEERLKWKRAKPLHLLLLRVYRLEEPVELPMQPAYNGCKSWVKLDEGMPQSVMTPVLSDDEFAKKIKEIKQSLIGSDISGGA
ncbi:DUF1802 family protein [Paenibacillus glycanilyticus]|uniref:DUF1802 family protein n=1 Tax=Paenibacillus glycanilyticus TaxID=126569 RepID=A0ABQ6G8U9_9BACL|nr:DUF1802 family protein [Paenibacillus glycanilyticus]GLX65688.1 hypothetical protein MU1_00320 [Paenibacillus glycanilyticus]